jgi:hypothetical protein
MWYGLATQSIKTEAEKFSNELDIRRNEEAIGNYVIQQATKRAEQAKQDEALWKQMRKEFPKW